MSGDAEATPSDPTARVEALAGARVLVVGDVILDRFVSGSVTRVSREAPIPVLQVRDSTAMLGGAGNVVRNLWALGAEGRLVAAIADDAAGAEVAQLAEAEAPGSTQLLLQDDRPTSVKIRYLASGQQLLRTDWEEARPLKPEAAERLRSAAAAELDRADALVLSDYGNGVLTPETVRALIHAAQDRGVPVVIDPRADDYRVYAGAEVVTPNRAELERAAGLPVGESGGPEADAEAEAAARALCRASGVANVLGTRGARGMTLVEGPDGPVRHLPAQAREVYDVSGAGDTVVAVVAAARAAGQDLAEAARLANIAAGIVVGKVGTAVVRPDELLRALHTARLLQAEAKVLSRDAVAERVAAWRRTGLTVGFTNGCFDLLHPGHVALLEQARAACDRLVVALNADASVRRLKGPDRPVQDQAARAAVLASLADVDAVTLFEEDTPEPLLALLRPEVWIKGADYTRATLPGAELVEGYGGRIVFAELAAGHSTSATVRRLQNGG